MQQIESQSTKHNESRGFALRKFRLFKSKMILHSLAWPAVFPSAVPAANE